MYHNIKSLQKAILQLCSEKNITVNKLSTNSGLTQSTIDSILKGKSKNPKIATLQKIASGFGIDFQRFLSYIDSMEDILQPKSEDEILYSSSITTEEDIIVIKTISTKIKQLRKEKGITLVDISKALNVARFNENTISFSILIPLADYFNVSLDYLFGRSDDPTRH